MKRINNKKSEQELTKKAILYTFLIVVGSIFFIWIVGAALKFPRIYKILLIDDLITLRMTSSMLIIGGCILLIYTYLKDYLILKNELTAALAIAMISLMIVGISLNPFIGILMPQFNIFIIQTLALFFILVSLAILVWISYK